MNYKENKILNLKKKKKNQLHNKAFHATYSELV